MANFVGNMSNLDALAALSLVGLSRVVEITYVSPNVQPFNGSFVGDGLSFLSLGTGSRTVEVPYTSNAGEA